MSIIGIQYQSGRPLNVLPDVELLLLYGMDCEDAVGPILGAWDPESGLWADHDGEALGWQPLYFAVPPANPCQSISTPTVGNEVV